MFKRIFIAIFLIAVSVFIGIYSLNKTTRICSNMISRLEKTTKEVMDIKETYENEFNLVQEIGILFLMFIGRIGILSLLLAFFREDKKNKFVEYPSENVIL